MSVQAAKIAQLEQRVAELEQRVEVMTEIADKWLDRYLDEQKRAEAAERELTDQRKRLASAIGTTRYMDPPDGGDVPLDEQVRRMSAHNRTLEAALLSIATFDCYTREGEEPPAECMRRMAQEALANRSEAEQSYESRAEEETWELKNAVPDPQDDAGEALQHLKEWADCGAAWSSDRVGWQSEVGQWVRIVRQALRARCPHIVTSDEGTQYCALAEQAARVPDSVRRLPDDWQSRDELDFPMTIGKTVDQLADELRRALAEQGEGGEG